MCEICEMVKRLGLVIFCRVVFCCSHDMTWKKDRNNTHSVKYCL